MNETLFEYKKPFEYLTLAIERLIYTVIVYLLAFAVDIIHQIYEHTWSELLLYIWQSLSTFMVLNAKYFPIIYFLGLLPLGLFVLVSFYILIKFIYENILCFDSYGPNIKENAETSR